MKNNSYEYNKSSFLGMPKDAALIFERILASQNVLKLLEYNLKDWKNQPDVTNEQVQRMFEIGQISLSPRIEIINERKTRLHMTYGTTTRNKTNPEYRDNVFRIDIICHIDDWNLGNFELRPYRLAGEIDSLLDKTHLTGIGLLEFISASPRIYNDEYAGLTLSYVAIRGNEDKVKPLS